MVGIINAGEYGRAIHDAWLRRQLIDLGETVVNNAFGAEPELDGRAQIEVAEQSLFDLSNRGGEQGGFMTFERALTEALRSAEAAFKRTGHVSGISTGLRDLDSKMGGLHPSDLVILAGRPGMGKTALATKIAYGAARAMLEDARRTSPDVKHPGAVAVFSLEMSAEQLATRLLAEQARVSGDQIRRGEIGRRTSTASTWSAANCNRCRSTSTTRRQSRSRRCARAAGGSSNGRRACRWWWWTTCS